MPFYKLGCPDAFALSATDGGREREEREREREREREKHLFCICDETQCITNEMLQKLHPILIGNFFTMPCVTSSPIFCSLSLNSV